MLSTTANPRVIRLLQVLVACIFIGRAYQAIFFDIHLRALLWDEDWVGGIVWILTGWSWQEYVTNIYVDIVYQRVAELIGVLWLVCGIVALQMRPDQRWARRLLRVGAVLLLFLHFLNWKDRFFLWGQLLEHAAQAFTPWFLIYLMQNKFVFTNRFLLVVKISIALTFFCHGLFAYGFYPVPADWQEWCINVFGFTDTNTVKLFLKIMGILDFAVAGLIFWKPTFSIAVGYCIVWGTLTALARIVANVYWVSFSEDLHQWWFETLYRFVHGGLPLFLWWLSRLQASGNSLESSQEINQAV